MFCPGRDEREISRREFLPRLAIVGNDGALAGGGVYDCVLFTVVMDCGGGVWEGGHYCVGGDVSVCGLGG